LGMEMLEEEGAVDGGCVLGLGARHVTLARRCSCKM
jgi:hypothetical protein